MLKRMVAGCLLVLALASIAFGADSPRPVRESIEWLDIWIPSADQSNLPRVLLIGDSITRGYYPKVEKALEGRASCARLTTSRSLGDPVLFDELRLVLRQYPFAVIHFNNGLHGWGYTETQYGDAFPEFLRLLRKEAPTAKLIWATTTPVRTPNKLAQLDNRTDRVKARNRIAADQVGKYQLPINDLFTLVEAHPEYYSNDGTHFNQDGITAEAAQVAGSVLQALPAAVK